MSKLPFEILNKIFVQLKNQDLRQASAVCKSWNTIATYFLNNTLCISLDEDQFARFRNDIQNHPSFAAKVSTLIIKSSDTATGPGALQNILNKCRNLKVLVFRKTQIYDYLQMLTSSYTKLRKIQKIEIPSLMSAAPSIKRLNIYINFKHKRTITSLQFADIEANNAFKRYGGLYKYISRFPHLTCIKINGGHHKSNFKASINLHDLLNASNTIDSLTFKDVEFESDGQNGLFMNSYSSLKRLYLRDFYADNNFLDYILHRFKSLEILSLTGGEITQIWTTFDELPTEALGRFNSISTIKSFYYSYKSEGILFTNRKVGARFIGGIW